MAKYGIIEFFQNAFPRFRKGTKTIDVKAPESLADNPSYVVTLLPALPSSTQAVTISSTGQLGTTAISNGSGTGSVTSIGITLPSVFTVTNSPVTSTGTIAAAFVNQTANRFFASPDGVDGTPVFRSLTGKDLVSTLPTSTQAVTINASGQISTAAIPTSAGTVTSIGLDLPSIFAVTSSPVTSAGTIAATLNTQPSNTFFASPDGTDGKPIFRSLGWRDLLSSLPALPDSVQAVTLDSSGQFQTVPFVSSVGLGLPSIFNVTNSPVTSTGTIAATLASQTANKIFASPDSVDGAPLFRGLLWKDIQSLAGTTATSFAIGNDARFHAQNTDLGTTAKSFQVDSASSGFRLKNNAGNAEIRNAADDSFASLTVGKLYSQNAATEITSSRFISALDAGSELYYSGSNPILLSIDASTLPLNSRVTVSQDGTGEISFSVSGGSINGTNTQKKTSKQYGTVALIKRSNGLLIMRGDFTETAASTDPTPVLDLTSFQNSQYIPVVLGLN